GAAGVAGVAVDVDQDVDPVGADLRGGRLVAHFADVDPVLDRGLDPLVQRALVLAPAIVGEDLDVLAVVQLEELGHQVADGVVAQVGGDIAHAQAPAGEVDLGRAAV